MKRQLSFSIIFFLLTSSATLAQSDRIDRLIDSINNDQVGIVMQYVWYPSMKSRPGDSLIDIGKSATRKLINVLDDSSKGIIVHFILSKIYWIELSRTGHELGSNVSPVENKSDSSLRILYAGFEFYVNNKNHLFAKQEDLDNNKKLWQKFIEELSYY